MWLHVPSTSSLSALEQAVWSLVSSSPSLEPVLWVQSSGKPMQRPLSWRGWLTRPWVTLLSGIQLSPSTADRGVVAWISSLPGSPASRGQQQASSADSRTSDGSGATSRTSFAKWSPSGSFSKTSRGLFEEDSSPFSGAWPSSGSMRSGECSARPMSAPRISARGSSSWPTATAEDAEQAGSVKRGRTLTNVTAKWPTPNVPSGGQTFTEGSMSPTGRTPDGKKRSVHLSERVGMWPTPRANDPEKRGDFTADHRSGLPGAVQNWPTPQAADSERGSEKQIRGNPTLLGAARSGPQAPATEQVGPPCRRVLNPRFVESLQGLPTGWTDCGSAVTGWSRWQQRMRSALCALGYCSSDSPALATLRIAVHRLVR